MSCVGSESLLSEREARWAGRASHMHQSSLGPFMSCFQGRAGVKAVAEVRSPVHLGMNVKGHVSEVPATPHAALSPIELM